MIHKCSHATAFTFWRQHNTGALPAGYSWWFASGLLDMPAGWAFVHLIASEGGLRGILGKEMVRIGHALEPITKSHSRIDYTKRFHRKGHGWKENHKS